VRANREQGSSWQVNRSGGLFPTYFSSRNASHTVSVTLPGGHVDEFEFHAHAEAAPAIVPLQELSAV